MQSHRVYAQPVHLVQTIGVIIAITSRLQLSPAPETREISGSCTENSTEFLYQFQNSWKCPKKLPIASKISAIIIFVDVAEFRFFEIYNATVAALETPKKFPKSSQILETFLSGDSSGHVTSRHVTSRHVTYLASVRQLLHEASLDLHVSLQFGHLRLHQEHCVQKFRHDADEIQDDEKLDGVGPVDNRPSTD